MTGMTGNANFLVKYTWVQIQAPPVTSFVIIEKTQITPLCTSPILSEIQGKYNLFGGPTVRNK